MRTSPYYPQSNGKIERAQGTFKQKCIREKCPRTIEQAQRWVGEYIEHYNARRRHSAIGYVTPLDMLEGRQAAIQAERERKLDEAPRTTQTEKTVESRPSRRVM